MRQDDLPSIRRVELQDWQTSCRLVLDRSEFLAPRRVLKLRARLLMQLSLISFRHAWLYAPRASSVGHVSKEMAPLCVEEVVQVQDPMSLTSPMLQSIAHAAWLRRHMREVDIRAYCGLNKYTNPIDICNGTGNETFSHVLLVRSAIFCRLDVEMCLCLGRKQSSSSCRLHFMGLQAVLTCHALISGAD